MLSFGSDNAAFQVRDLKIQSTSVGIHALTGAHINVQNVDFGACTAAHIQAQFGAYVVGISSYTISGASPRHIRSLTGYVGINAVTITLTGTPAFSDAFVVAERLGYVTAQSVTLSGSATGPDATTQPQFRGLHRWRRRFVFPWRCCRDHRDGRPVCLNATDRTPKRALRHGAGLPSGPTGETPARSPGFMSRSGASKSPPPDRCPTARIGHEHRVQYVVADQNAGEPADDIGRRTADQHDRAQSGLGGRRRRKRSDAETSRDDEDRRERQNAKDAGLHPCVEKAIVEMGVVASSPIFFETIFDEGLRRLRAMSDDRAFPRPPTARSPRVQRAARASYRSFRARSSAPSHARAPRPGTV